METTQTKVKGNCDEQVIGRKENIDFGSIIFWKQLQLSCEF